MRSAGFIEKGTLYLDYREQKEGIGFSSGSESIACTCCDFDLNILTQFVRIKIFVWNANVDVW